MVEESLKALSGAEAPPARDHLVETAVLARIERRRFHRALERTAALALAGAAILALVMPGLGQFWPAELPLGALLPKGLVQPQMLPSVVNSNLALGMVMTVACLFLPWRRLLG